MRRRRPTAEAGTAPKWIGQSPRLTFPPEGGPPQPNATWTLLAKPGDGPADMFAVRARWRDAGRAWCEERGLVYAAAVCGRAVPGPLNAQWTASRGMAGDGA